MRWPAKVRAALLAGAAAAALTAPALAQAPANVEVDRLGDTARIRLVLPESEGGDLTVNAEIAADRVIVARLSDAVEVDVSGLRQAAPDYIAMARLDADGRTLRLALNRELEPRVSVSHNVLAIDLAPPGAPAQPAVVSPYERARQAEARARAEADAAAAAPPPPPPSLPVELRVGEASEYTRIVFQWPEPVTWSLEQADARAVLRFSRAAEIDLSELTAAPPRRVDAVTRLDEDTLALSFLLSPDAEARVWSDAPGRVALDVAVPGASGIEATLAALSGYADSLAPGETETEAPQDAAAAAETPEPAPVLPEAERPDPLPASGVVPVEVRKAGQDLVMSFPFANLPGAAVFRRAEALWIVFDAPAQLEAGEIAAAGGDHVEAYRAFTGADYAALRIEAPVSTLADVHAAGATWTVILTDTLDEPPAPVRLARETGFNRPAVMRVGFNGARSAVNLLDPVVGDRLLVLTADGDKRGVLSPRQFVEGRILASAHGLALEAYADDLAMTVEPGGARLERPGGLKLSRTADPALAAAFDRPMTPGFLDLARWRGDQPYVEGRARLQRAAVDLEPEALTALARFSLGWGLAHEALAYMTLAVKANPALETAPETAALQGAALYMAGRYDEAAETLDQASVLNDPAVQSWRALVAAQRRDWPTARRRFERGRDAAFFFDPVWRARISAWHALSALETGDLGAVRPLLDLVDAGADDPEADAVSGLAEAGLLAASGEIEAAVARYDALRSHPWRPVQTRAGLAMIQLQTEHGLVAADEAVEALESLRFQWRGDDTEVEAAAMLGRVYAQAGRYDEALRTMDATRGRFPESPVARDLSLEMDQLFRDLFLDGGADRMDPLSAVALWREHQSLTPPGPDGVRMVMGVVDRLVEIDLLDQAAAYLQYWIDERSITMTGQARATIAADLAEIYLTDGRPEAAMRAIESTRIAGLPTDLVERRRLLQARSLAGVGRTEHALELIANDRTEAADRLRARVAWDERIWPEAGRRAESLLADRWRQEGDLSPRESHDVLRALIAYALARDSAGMDRIEARYGAKMSRTDHARAFSMVASETVAPGDARLAAMVNELADLDDASTLMRGFSAAAADEDGAGPS
ncbi:MAG: tetratricopeptide repeat protein [Oceanicaulis sp.]